MAVRRPAVGWSEKKRQWLQMYPESSLKCNTKHYLLVFGQLQALYWRRAINQTHIIVWLLVWVGESGWEPHWQGASSNQYTLNSVTGSGHVKYKRNSLACKMHENSACNSVDSACNTHLPLSLILTTCPLKGGSPKNRRTPPQRMQNYGSTWQSRMPDDFLLRV